MKNKKKIIIASIATLLAGGAIVGGTTYAVFKNNSNVSITVNSAKVDVTALVDTESVYTKQLGGDYTLGTTSMYDGEVTVSNKAITLNNILPGDGVKFNIKVTNNSSVNTKVRTIVKALEDNELLDDLVIKINDEEFNGNAKSTWEDLAKDSTDSIITIEIELPEECEVNSSSESISLEYSLEAVQGNANVGLYEVTPSNVQEVLDNITGEATVVLTSGDYDTLYLRQDLDVSTRRSDLDKNASYPAYYRQIKDLKIVVKEGDTVTCDGVKAEAGLFWYNSAPASNQKEMNKETGGFLSFLRLENITIEGLTFDNSDQSAVHLRDNDPDNTKETSALILVNNFTVKNCTASGDITKKDYHFFSAGTGSKGTTFDDTNMYCYNNISLINNDISTYYQPICFNNSKTVLNGFKVKNNKFTGCDNNTLQISNKVNKGRFVFSGNTITNTNGRFARMANLDSSAKVTLKNNKIVTPTKYNDENAEVVKLTGTDGFTVYDNYNNWNQGSFTTSGTYISLGDTSLLPSGTYSN